MDHFLLTAWGTDGDVVPFITIGAELKRRGYGVTLISNPRFRGRAEEADLAFVPVGTEADYAAFVEDARVWNWDSAFKAVARHYKPTIEGFYEAVGHAHHPGRTKLFTSPGVIGAMIAWERFQIPTILGLVAPSRLPNPVDPPHPPRPFPSPIEWIARWRRGMRLLYGAKMAREGLRQLARGTRAMPSWRASLAEEVRRVRSLAGLPETPALGRSSEPASILCLWPRWFAPPVGRLPVKAKFTGFPIAFPATEAGPRSDDLVFTRGSVSTGQKEFFAAAVTCCRLLKRRGLLIAPHSQDLPPDLPPEVTYMPYADFVDVFARSAAVVHHGGVGTIACGIRAGTPQLALPMIGEQFDLANRMRRLGVGRAFSGAPTAERLARELRLLLRSKRIARRCAKLRGYMDSEPGPARAADCIEEVADLA